MSVRQWYFIVRFMSAVIVWMNSKVGPRFGDLERELEVEKRRIENEEL